LEEKFGWERERIEQLITSISNLTTVFKTAPWLHAVSDGPDNRILECGIKAAADFVVTGDKHLLQLRTYEHLEIIRLSTFLSVLHQSATK